MDITPGWCPICQEPLSGYAPHNGRCLIFMLNRIESMYDKLGKMKGDLEEAQMMADFWKYTKPPIPIQHYPLASSDKPRTTRGELLPDPDKPAG